MAALYQAYLEGTASGGHRATGAEALAVLRHDPPEVMVLDLNLPDLNGRDILAEVKRLGLPTAVIVVTADGSMSTAIAAMRAGAYDFLVKPFPAERLTMTVRNALERGRLRSSVEVLRDEFTRERFCGFIGASLAMQGVYRMIESAAPSNATVFITGESGTGKELAAEAIHQLSARRGKPFVAINCGAMAENLVESEIFGHVKGSFTGAISDRIGAAEAGRRRHAVPRRDLRDADRSAKQAPAFPGDRYAAAGRWHARSRRSTYASCARPTAIR